MVILICGDRKWCDKSLIRKTILDIGIQRIDIIIHGACVGADLLSQEVALELEIPYLGVPAKWTEFKRAAGPIRNGVMLQIYEKPDLVLAFHDDIENSKGTKNMMTQAEKAGIETRLVTH